MLAMADRERVPVPKVPPAAIEECERRIAEKRRQLTVIKATNAWSWGSAGESPPTELRESVVASMVSSRKASAVHARTAFAARKAYSSFAVGASARPCVNISYKTIVSAAHHSKANPALEICNTGWLRRCEFLFDVCTFLAELQCGQTQQQEYLSCSFTSSWPFSEMHHMPG